MDGSSKYLLEALEKQELKSKMPKRNVYVVKISFTDEAPERNISNA
jgi:UDP-3-O-[3-hydroxymyristoyl] N-acetylglucosamine deacetylase/3-hydroxyacyl-[acyl-carrier-protein] dehydratase